MEEQVDFQRFLASADARIASFPNEGVWDQGGFKPNRQLRAPEAGFCIVVRCPESVTGPLVRFTAEVQKTLPPVVEYTEASLHMTIGVFRKGHLADFFPDPQVLEALAGAVGRGLERCEGRPLTNLDTWLFNHEAVLCAGLPNRDFWALAQSIAAACSRSGHALETPSILHVTTLRFITAVEQSVFNAFLDVMARAPVFSPVVPDAVDVGTWRCDGLTFNLDVYRRFHLSP